MASFSKFITESLAPGTQGSIRKLFGGSLHDFADGTPAQFTRLGNVSIGVGKGTDVDRPFIVISIDIDDAEPTTLGKFRSKEEALSFARNIKKVKIGSTGTKYPFRSLVVRNRVQAALFHYEITGQISDGAWENASPNNHWQDWSSAKVFVGPNVGRNFFARKSNYRLTSLIEYVGDRMIWIAKCALAGVPLANSDLYGTEELATKELADTYDYLKNKLKDSDLSEVPNIRKQNYDEAKLRKDLSELSKAMKIVSRA